jgi:hypothetical protein
VDRFVPQRHNLSLDGLRAEIRQIEKYLAEIGAEINARAEEVAQQVVDDANSQPATLTVIPETQVLFDTSTGHNHDGTDSTLITLAGDVSGTNAATTVDKIKNVAVTAPVAGDDEKFLSYEHSGPSYTWDFVTLAGDVTGTNPTTSVVRIQGKDIAAPAAGNDEQAVTWDQGSDDFVYRDFTRMTLLGAWTSADISALGTTDVEILNCFTSDTVLSNPMPVAGKLRGISIKLSGDVGGAGNDFTATAYLNGSPTTLTATVTGGAGTENEAVATVTPVTFAAGDDLAVFAKETGTAAAVRATVLIWGFFQA